MASVVWKNNKFVCECGFDEKDIAKGAGFWWDKENRYWWTGDPGKAKRLKAYAAESALEQFKAADDAVVMSHAANSDDIDIPVPEGLEYLPFQKAGIHYCSGKEAALIGDDMGLGKTIQAAGLINMDGSIKNVIVICPAILKLNWKIELQRWLVRNYKVSIGFGTQLKTADYFVKSDKDVYGTILIINYDILKDNLDGIAKGKYDLLIADEAHYLKHWESGRTKAAASIAEVAKRKLFLTGTPITKYPMDLLPILKMSKHFLAQSWRDFTGKYCNPVRNRWGITYGSSNEAELQKNLRSGFMVRRMKKDVLSELPAKRRQVIVLPADTVRTAIEAEKAYIRARKENVKKIRRENSFEDAFNMLRENKSADITEMVRLRKETAIAKIPAAIQHIISVLDTENKVVIFAHHKEVIAAVYEHFQKEAVLITGDTESGQRQEKIQAFQNNSEIRVFCATIMSCGTGVTLHAAQTAVFLEMDWLPANIEQAEDRLHRIGQAGNVLTQFLVVDGSIDAMIAKSLTRKKKVIDKVTNLQKGGVKGLSQK